MLAKGNEGRIIFQRAYRAQKLCPYKNPQGLAEAMSHAMAEISTKIIDDMYKSIGGFS
ncbi:MAG: hypothetical protein ACMUJM_19005 [bacterium]